ncbi:MAG: 4-phosphopantetheinyl transferase family protein [Chloroflexi bacterium]|nr:MAG: 4-phosphopantetheinyl transferase family protein [Chloroflexota bacterium]
MRPAGAVFRRRASSAPADHRSGDRSRPGRQHRARRRCRGLRDRNRPRGRSDLLRVAATVCNDREMRLLHSLDAAERADAFLRVWTVKEAVLKATGLASRVDPRDLTVSLDGGRPPRIEFDPDMHEDAARWRLAIRRIPPSHVAAVAVSGMPAPHIPVWLEQR